MVAGLRCHISHNSKPRVVLELHAEKSGTVRLGNGQDCEIAGTGEVPIQLPNDNTITLHQVRHVPALKRSLVSINMLAEDGYKTTLNESTWMISRGNLRIGRGHKYEQLVPTDGDQYRRGRECRLKDQPEPMARPTWPHVTRWT